jgi:segregation and condensation protein A
MEAAAPYRVELEIFTGPLDLLLYLVRRNELDIRDLKLSRITDQFQQFLELLELLDLDLIGDFLVTAATLVEIKSRESLPRPPEPEEETPVESGDPSSELVQQLLEYRKFKDAALALEERAALWQERYPRLSSERPGTGKDPAADFIREVELWDLVSALGRILKQKDVEQRATVRYDETPIQVYIDRIGKIVRDAGRATFSSLFGEETERSRIVGMFLAVLELLRNHGFRAEQLVDYGEIVILPPAHDSQSAGNAGQAAR